MGTELRPPPCIFSSLVCCACDLWSKQSTKPRRSRGSHMVRALPLGGSLHGLSRQLSFGSEPVIDVMAVFPATLFIEGIRAAPNLFLPVRVGYDVSGHIRVRILRHVGRSFLPASEGDYFFSSFLVVSFICSFAILTETP